MLGRPRRIVAGLVTGGLLVSACQQPPSPTPEPPPSYRCTPEAGGEEFDCNEIQHAQMVAKDKLYAEAEAVYRKYHAENVRVLRMGGADKPTPILLETTTGDFLADATDSFRDIQENGISARGEDRSMSFTRLPGKSKTGSVVALAVCIDGRSIEFFRRGKPDGHGQVTRDETYFVRVDGKLRITGADGEVVKKCE